MRSLRHPHRNAFALGLLQGVPQGLTFPDQSTFVGIGFDASSFLPVVCFGLFVPPLLMLLSHFANRRKEHPWLAKVREYVNLPEMMFWGGISLGLLGLLSLKSANADVLVTMTYRSDNGQRPNNDVEQRQISAQFKQQLTAHDTIYFQASDYRAKAGDVSQYYDQRSANPHVRTLETQEPIVLAGYHREWSPGHHTLFLGARLNDELTVHNPLQPILVAVRGAGGQVIGVAPTDMNQDYNSKLTI